MTDTNRTSSLQHGAHVQLLSARFDRSAPRPPVSTTDYVIDILLIAVIFRLVSPGELSPRDAPLPLVLVIAAGSVYVRPTTLGGNDVLLIIVLIAAGAVLGLASGRADRTW